MLKENEEQLYNLLIINDDFQSYNNLANEMNVSKRTIYNLLEKIEPFLEKNNFFIEKKYGHGIKLSMIDKGSGMDAQTNIHSSIEYRREVLKLKLIFDYKNYTSINEICEQLNITKNSVVLDLNYIEFELKKYNLILQKNWYGTKIAGKRKNLKLAIIDSCHKYGTNIIYKNSELFKNNEKLNYIIRSKKLEKIVVEGLDQIFDHFNYEINMDYFDSLLIHLIIDLVFFGEEVSLEKENNNEKKPGTWLKAYIERKLGMKFKKNYNKDRFDEYLVSFNNKQNYATQTINMITNQIIQNFSYIMGVKYINEEEISNSLNNLVEKILLRKEFRIGVFHPFLNYLINKFNEEFIALRLAVYEIDEYFEIINADELSFLFTILFNACFRQNKKVELNLQTDYGGTNKNFIKSIIEDSNKLVKVENSNTGENHKLTLIHSENNKYFIEGDKVYANILNPVHLTGLNEEIYNRIQYHYYKKVHDDWTFEEYEIDIVKPNKLLVLNKISEYLINTFFLEKNEQEQFISNENQLSIFWFSKQAALIIHENTKAELNDLKVFSLNGTIKWRSQNELSRINKVYVLLTNKIDITELEYLYSLIKYNVLYKE